MPLASWLPAIWPPWYFGEASGGGIVPRSLVPGRPLVRITGRVAIGTVGKPQITQAAGCGCCDGGEPGGECVACGFETTLTSVTVTISGTFPCNGCVCEGEFPFCADGNPGPCWVSARDYLFSNFNGTKVLAAADINCASPNPSFPTFGASWERSWFGRTRWLDLPDNVRVCSCSGGVLYGDCWSECTCASATLDVGWSWIRLEGPLPRTYRLELVVEAASSDCTNDCTPPDDGCGTPGVNGPWKAAASFDFPPIGGIEQNCIPLGAYVLQAIERECGTPPTYYGPGFQTVVGGQATVVFA